MCPLDFDITWTSAVRTPLTDEQMFAAWVVTGGSCTLEEFTDAYRELYG